MKRDATGNIRSIRTEWAEWDLTNEVWRPAIKVTVEEYRPDGQAHSSEFSMANNAPLQTSHFYDDGGWLVESQYRSAGDLTSRTTYSYNADGRLICKVAISPAGAEQGTEQYAYSADGGYTKVRELPPMKGAVGYACEVDGFDVYLTVEGARRMVTIYGPDGLAVEVTLADADGEALRRLVISRDDSGQIVKSQVLLGGKPMIPEMAALAKDFALLTQECSYDEQGRRVELREQMFGLADKRETYRYDDHGNRIAVASEESVFQGGIGEDGKVQRQGEPRVERRDTRFTYRYDARGNWIERITSQRYGDNPDPTPSGRELREITYFD